MDVLLDLNAEATNDTPRGTPMSHFEYAETPHHLDVCRKRSTFLQLTQNLSVEVRRHYSDGDSVRRCILNPRALYALTVILQHPLLLK